MECKYIKNYLKQNISPWMELDNKIKCFDCKKEITFGSAYNVYCSPKCLFYHKYVCGDCAEKIWKSEPKKN